VTAQHHHDVEVTDQVLNEVQNDAAHERIIISKGEINTLLQGKKMKLNEDQGNLYSNLRRGKILLWARLLSPPMGLETDFSHYSILLMSV
jgi:hypothetical protein